MSNLIVDGDCFRSVVDRIAAEHGDQAAGSVRKQAIELIEKSTAAYETAFGHGDVGASGSGLVSNVFRPSELLPIGRDTNGLVYGKVQSGKTNLSIASVALAVANGFRVFVVLTSDNTWLGKQTFARFRDQLQVDGPVVVHWEGWRRHPEEFGRDLRTQIDDVGVVFVCTKNVRNLEGLLAVLKTSDARRVPGIVFDDEADNASLNTRESKQTNEQSRVFEQIGRLRRSIPNHIYLQVTATPQSLLLQTIDNPLRPAFAITCEPGENYVGGDLFFAPGSKYVRIVDAAELDELRSGRINPGRSWSIPDGLRLATCCFVLGAAFKMQGELAASDYYSMLIHICHKRINHESIANSMRAFIRELDQALRSRLGDTRKRQSERWLLDARAELEKTATLPTQDELLGILRARLRSAAPEIINADNPNREPEYRPGMNILIGGNRLGRGVTIKGLMVTYYGRDAKQKMMDTVHQHARMFGYRRALLDVTRLFSARHIIDVFTDIHQSDEGTRAVVREAGDILHVKPVWVGRQLRPTRANVLNPASIGTLPPVKAIYPPRPLYRRVDVASHTATLDDMLTRYSDGDFHEVPIQFLIDVLRHTPSRPVEGYSWDDDRVRQALVAVQRDPIGMRTGKLQVVRTTRGDARALRRSGDATTYVQGTGYLSGPETKQAREQAKTGPVLSLVYERGLRRDGWDDQPFYAPTLILPATRFAFMFAYDYD